MLPSTSPVDATAWLSVAEETRPSLFLLPKEFTALVKAIMVQRALFALTKFLQIPRLPRGIEEIPSTLLPLNGVA